MRSNNRKKFFMGLFLVLSTVTTSGCWDKVEIDRRAIVLALGIDKYEKPGDTINKYLITYSFPNASSGSAGGSAQGGGKGEPKFDISVKGRNFFDANRNIFLKLDKAPYYADAKTVVFGESLLKDRKLFKYTLDVIMRQDEFSKTASYMGVKGKAQKVIKSTPKANPFVGAYISSIISNNMQSLKYPDGNAARILSDLVSSGATIMPCIFPGKKDIKASGCYVIKDYKMAGFLDGNETRGLLFIIGKGQGGVYTSDGKSKSFSYEISSSDVQKKITFVKGVPNVAYNVKVSGNLAQYYNDKAGDFKGKIDIKDIEKKVGKGLKANMEMTIKKLQDEYKVDVIGIGDYISKHYPSRWRKVKKNWNDIFSKSNITVRVKAYIDSLGTSQ